MILQMPLADGTVAVSFRLPAAIWGDRATLVGNFNGWSRHATPMRLGEEYWEARLILCVGEHYFYAYLIDGTDWCTEAPAQERALGAALPVSVLPLDLQQVRRYVAAR